MMGEPVGLTSSNLKSAAYDPDTQTLRVTFVTGSVYEYSSVPRAVYDGLLTAPSAGRFFNNNIKGTYPTDGRQ